jgi:drug/metabolite transporter (DMT)-like permease
MLYARAGTRITAPWLNFIKGLISSAAFVLTLVVLGKPLLGPFCSQPVWPLFLLGVSGLIGIAVGDTAYFACIRQIGARQAALLSLLAVPAASAGGLLFLGERLPSLAWLGIAVTLAGIMWVVSERSENLTGIGARYRRMPGLVLGLVASICQAAGALLNRSVVRHGEFDDLWVAAWRLAAATVSLSLVLPFFARRPAILSDDQRFWRYILPATLLGTYGGVWLQQAAFARADAGYVQTLLSTVPIWILPLAMIAGDRISWRAVLGSLIGLAGVVLLILSTRNLAE